MDDSDFIPSSLQPSKGHSTSKNLTTKSKSSSDIKASIESDSLLPDADKDKCYICNKDLRHLNEIRKSLHINSCLDQQESKTKFTSETEKWTNTLDCPMCGEPLQAGPYRAAHAKRCGKKHNVPAARLLVLMETQSKVAEMRKKNGMPHTKLSVPKLEVKKPSRLKEEPRSVFEEQMKIALAMSASIDSSSDSSFKEVPKEVPIVKPSKKGDSRKSYSFLELEPRSCKCAVLEQVQENFVNKFKMKRYANFRQMMRNRRQRSLTFLGDLNKCIRKLERLERLADDLGKQANLDGDVAIYSKEDVRISAHRFIVSARAPLMAALINEENSMHMKDYSAASIRCYIQFLYSSSIEWTNEERDEISELAARFGPPELVQCCKVPSMRAERVYDEEMKETDFFDSGGPKIEVSHGLKPSEPSTPGLQHDSQKSFTSACAIPAMSSIDDTVLNEVNNYNPDSGSNVGCTKQPGGSAVVDTDESQNTIIFLDDSLPPSQMEALLKKEDKKGEFAPSAPRRLVEDLKINRLNSKVAEGSPDIFDVPSEQEDEVNMNKGSVKTSSTVSSVNESVGLRLETANQDTFTMLGSNHLIAEPGTSSVDTRSTPKKQTLKKRDFCHHIFDEANGLLSPITKEPCASTSKDYVEEEKSYLQDFEYPSFLHDSEGLQKSPVLEKSPAKSRSPKRKRIGAEIQYSSTPVAETGILAKRLKELGSNVKVIKTSNITPMPVYEQMTDKELKNELARFGVRPMGKKKAVALLKRIYEETHPVVGDASPVSSRKHTKTALADGAKGAQENRSEGSGDAAEEALANCTLNVSLDEDKIQEESAVDLMEDNGPLPKDLDGMQSTLLAWLRRDENEELYNQLLTLNPISFDEFADRLSRSDSTAAAIPKKALIEILDRLHITFRLPADGWKRRHQKAKLKKQKK